MPGVIMSNSVLAYGNIARPHKACLLVQIDYGEGSCMTLL